MSSQDSYEEVVPDTPSIRKTHLNDSEELTAPPSKQRKKKEKKRQLGNKTVKDDTIDVMRMYILTSSSLTEKDIGVERESEVDNDLETDAGPDSADELENPNREEIIKETAERLKKIGDEIDKKYGEQISKAMESLLTPLLEATRYDSFSAAIGNLSQRVFGNDPDVDALAFVFYLTRRYIEAAKEAGRQVEEYMGYGQQYVMETYGTWIEEHGGWGQVLHPTGGTETSIE